MNDLHFTEEDFFGLLTIAEVADRLKLKDNDSATKWLKNQGITIHKLPKNVVYKLEVDCALAKPLLLEVKRKHPLNWEAIFRKICNNGPVYDMVVGQSGEVVSHIPSTKVLPKTKKEESLLKRLTS